MKRLIGTTALVGGALLVVVPRFVLPACEWAGHPAMRCSRTAHAEMIAGALLVGLGAIALFARRPRAVLLAGVLALGIFAVAWMLPERIGYCHNVRMPCTYGMVPGIRFLAGVNGLGVLVGLLGASRGAGRRRTA